MKKFVALTFGLLLSGCASYSGSDLVAGKSTVADAQQSMGGAHQQLKLANGDTALYFSRLPYGRAMYVATFGPDGILKTMEQRMQYGYFAKVVKDSWGKKEVAELLGPPGRTGRFDRQKREWWEYRYRQPPELRVVWVQFSDDGVVREMYDTTDPDEDRKKVGDPSGRG